MSDSSARALRVTVTIGTAPQRMLELTSPVLCGSGRAADVRVIDPAVAPLMLRLTREGDRVVAIAAAPGVVIDGVPAAVDQPVVVTGKAIQVGPARLVAAGAASPEAVLALLADRAPAPDAELPDTGVGLVMERVLSPLCVVSPGYGTRSSTALTIHRDGVVEFRERSHDAPGDGSDVSITMSRER